MFDAPPTPLDVHFRAFGFPVRVSPWFWLVTVLFGARAAQGEHAAALPLWVGCVFGSILLHELGHAVAFRRYGSWAPRIVLHGFGGLAIGDRPPAGRWQRIVIALAGPGAQLLLFAAVWGSHKLTGWATTNELTELLYRYLVSINLLWALVNLLPVMPLDGGQVCLNLLAILRVRRAEVKAWGISAGTAGLVVVVSVLNRLNRLPPAVSDWLPFTLSDVGILFVGLLAFQSYRQMLAAGRAYATWDDDPFRGRRGRW